MSIFDQYKAAVAPNQTWSNDPPKILHIRAGDTQADEFWQSTGLKEKLTVEVFNVEE